MMSSGVTTNFKRTRTGWPWLEAGPVKMTPALLMSASGVGKHGADLLDAMLETLLFYSVIQVTRRSFVFLYSYLWVRAVDLVIWITNHPMW